MNDRLVATHTVRIPAPVDQCHRFFTPAGEELWVDGWRPTYVWPADGRTEQGMVFTTGAGDDYTIWTLVDFDIDAHYSRYLRVTPSSRCVVVEVSSVAEGDEATRVTVTYTLTALSPSGRAALAAFETVPYAAMIDDWAARIRVRLPRLLEAQVR